MSRRTGSPDGRCRATPFKVRRSTRSSRDSLAAASRSSGAAFLLVVASVTPFAFTSFVYPSLTDSSYLYAGSQFHDVCTGTGCYSGWTATYSYAQSMGDLYSVAWWLLAAGVLLSLLALSFAVLGALGRPTSLLTWVLSFAGAGLAILGPLTVLAFQPHAYAADWAVVGNQSGYFPCGAPGGSPCTSFFGSAPGGGGTNVWGAGAGWYAALAAGVLLLVGGVISRPPRDDPRIHQARLALLTVLTGSVIFTVVYSVIWREFPGDSSFFFLVALLVIPAGVCVFLSVSARRRLRRARSVGGTPS
jgi:hypothetical protein